MELERQAQTCLVKSKYGNTVQSESCQPLAINYARQVTDLGKYTNEDEGYSKVEADESINEFYKRYGSQKDIPR